MMDFETLFIMALAFFIGSIYCVALALTLWNDKRDDERREYKQDYWRGE